MPNENYIYYSDSKNNPYGDKTCEQIQEFCDNIVAFFIQQKCKAIVIACNTASSEATNFLRNKYKNIPFIAIEPAYKMVYDYAYDKPTLIMATNGTIKSEKFNLLLKKYDNHKTYLLACRGLADKIENGNVEEIRKYLKEQLSDYKGKVENVVLGCTHYPLIQKEIEEILGKVTFFNGAPNLAKHLKKILEKSKILNKGEGNIKFIDSQGIKEKEERFFELLKRYNKNE